MTMSASVESMPPQFPDRLSTLLVATDFSAPSGQALEWAAGVARAHGARIVITHAMDARIQASFRSSSLVEEIRRRLSELCAMVAARGVAIGFEIAFGPPWDVLPRLAENAQADLLVVGALGTGTLRTGLLGTAADRIVRSSSIPVLVHREQNTAPARSAIGTVLAGIDFSEESLHVAHFAALLASPANAGARLVLLHAIAPFPAHGTLIDGAPVPDGWEEDRQSAAQQLDALARSLAQRGHEAEVRIVAGFPAEAILHEAAAVKADLIAVGTTGRAGFNRFLLGSEAERILHRANCPVLALRRRRAP